ncbi:selenocysteine-specific translation elongation factor [Halopseudomonas nanhaiensis]|uniref:selenocysteine-specific translation elongation factor n=1 Tax=Halopseudomonas nanhaiensis TaxID=2830842 RepID=UPI001CBF5A53|nr:selenocysteine-specific translation elongation factor [Halopseudomonas nanhaiensis]UAW99683.1 selenocysteine-specific translation elongation factor [Halopseudomonas nanhaiensis]
MIVATAGHVDHGKTSLVRALTGQDTDRTEEERRRGLSIELGFAWLQTADGTEVDIVDVPGHERFMRTMMAGVGAVDAVMLVVAADEGAMPQTLEHIELIHLLAIDRVVVVLTKVFRATLEQREALAQDVRQRLAEAGIPSVQTVEVDSLTGLGIDRLRQILSALAAHCPPPHTELLSRFWIDRHFHRPGAAHVVTGTLYQGCVTPGQSLRLTPGGAVVRIRAVQRHGRPVQRLMAGERGALDLAGDLPEQGCERGAQLLDEHAWLETRRLDARMDRLTSHSTRGDLQLHLAGNTVTARHVPLRGIETDDGKGYAQWILAEPLACRHGDRFIVRNATTHRLVASGVVVDPTAPGRGRQSPARLRILHALDEVNLLRCLQALLAVSEDGLDLDWVRRSRHVSSQAMEATIAPLVEDGQLYRRGSWVCARSQLGRCVDRLLDSVDAFHGEYPQMRGPSFPALARRLGISLPSALLSHAVRQVLDQHCIVQSGPCLHRPGHQPQPSPDSADMFGRMLPLFHHCAPRPPVIGELLDTLELERDSLQTALDELSALGWLVFVGRNRYLLPDSADQLYQSARELASRSADGGFSAAEFRDLTRIGRNHSIAVLEYFDRSGLTRLRLGRRWLAGPAAP